ncbi:hypothetical protein fugu_002781 [Takifugu bimaculatus]|uniref:Uncharacterized protein n=1 Tax=Takifugu bimaculatus TaxID=433685 RepID=A0A4Z2BEU7_9TELE|nr:hypothetical protein fugu_002781 [Takifugu bimaculatus]
MSTNKTKKVKMATKSCPECDQQVRKVLPTHKCGSVGLRTTSTQPAGSSGGSSGFRDLIPLSRLRWRLHKASLLQLDLKPSRWRLEKPLSSTTLSLFLPPTPKLPQLGSSNPLDQCNMEQPCSLRVLSLIGILSADKLDLKRRRTERIRRERIDSSLTSDMENRRRSRANSQSDPIRRGRGRPKTVGVKKQEDDREKQEKEVDIYAGLSDEKAFVFSVALAEINRKILGQTLIL